MNLRLKFICLLLLCVYGVNAQFAPENVGKPVNSSLPETAPVISPDGKTLYFAIENHPNNTKGAGGSQDIWYSEKMWDGTWSVPEHVPATINQEQYNGLVAVMSDGRLFIRGGFVNGKFAGPGYSFVTKDENGWGIPKMVDIKGYADIMRGELEDAAITPDGKVLVLSYNAVEGGKTRDMFVSFLQTDGSYSEPLNMGETINSNKNDFAPFIASDGITIYFASDRKGGLGSSDIYYSKRLDDTWTQWSAPVNMGAPINTTGFESYFSISASGNDGYMTTSTNSLGGSDIVRIKLKEEAKPNPVALVIGRTYNVKTKEAVTTTVEVVELPDNKPYGKEVTASSSGGFNVILTTGKRYSLIIKAEGYITAIENIDLSEQKVYTELSRNIALVPDDPSKHHKNANVFTMTANISKDSLTKDLSRINIESRIKQLQGTHKKPILVFLTDKNGKVLQTAVVNSEGVFRFTNLPADIDYSISFDVPADESDIQFDLMKVLNADNNNEVYITNLSAQKTIEIPISAIKNGNYSGRIVSADGNKPAAGIRVYLLDEAGKIIATTKTDAEGIFLFEKLSPDTKYSISFDAIDDATKAKLKLDESYIAPDPNSVIKTLKKTVTIPVSMLKNGVLHSRVINAQTNKPMEGVTVYLIDENGKIVATTKTDAEGSFRFDKLPMDNKYSLSYDAPQDNTSFELKIDEKYVPKAVLDAEKEAVKKITKEAPIIKEEKTVKSGKVARYRFESIFFDFNADELRPEAKNVLNDLVKHIKENPGIVVELNGHTDDSGDPEFNKKLAARRTKSAVKYLTAKGVKRTQLKEIHMGEELPVGDNTTEEGRQLNRRIEFYIDEANDYTPAYTVYIVKPEDKIADIAAKYGMTTDELKAANSLNSEELKPYSPLRVKKTL